MTTEFRRKYAREYHVSFIRYHLNVLDRGNPTEVHGIGVSVDISEEGLGLITQYSLE